MELFDEAAERAAAGTLSEPAPGHRPAFGARELNGDLRHPVSLGAPSDAAVHKCAPFRLQVSRVWLRVPETAADDLGKDGQVMDRFNALGRGTQLMLVGAVLLFIDLFLPWQKYTGPGADFIEAAGGDTSLTAFHGFGGWVLGLLTLVLIAWIVARMAAVEIPIPVSAAMTAGVFAFLILIFAVIKALVDDYSGWAAWVGIVLAAIVAVGAWLQIQEAGGVEHLKNEATSLGSSGGAASATAAQPPAAAAPAPAQPTESAASEAPEAASDAADAASDAASDEPSTEQGR